MTDNSSKPSIPGWQRSSTPPTDSAEQTAEATDNAPDVDRSALLEQAKTFLSDPTIRDATTSRKIAFLESKGLTNDEIDSLLGVSRNQDASADTQSDTQNSKQQEEEGGGEAKTSTASATAVSTTAPSTSASPRSRDVPPIITYPEFLVNAPAQHNPPLLSLRSVLYTLYGAASLGATVYGASEMLVKPMLKTLIDARHELAETTLANLSTMNEKLSKTVSTIPAYAGHAANEKEDSDDTDSITSDPTEVFHRDIATQTSPDLLNDRNIALPTTTPGEEDPGNNPHRTIDSHTRSLTQITDHLRDFIVNDTTSRDVDSSMRDRISDLQTYLDGLSYSSYNSYLNNNSIYNNIYSSSSNDWSRNASSTKEEDAISTFRVEIRSVKGALLSARNFPSGRPTGVTR